MSYAPVRLYKDRICAAQQNCPFLIGYGAFTSIPKTNSSRSRGMPSRGKRSVAKGNTRRPNRRPSGRGDRIVRAPAAVGRVTGSGLNGRSRVPTMRSSGRNMTVNHTERFASVTTTTTAFEIRSFSLNPGLAAIFPWMSDVANRYEKYKFRSVRFRYVPQSAALAGTVSLAFDFDPNDDAPTSMEEANTYHDYVTTSIWTGAELSIDLANGDRLPQKDTRPGLPGADIDLNVYDVGRLHVMTFGAAASVVGYLEVSYVVDLFIHQTQAGVGGSSTTSTGLDATHLIGSNFSPDPQAFLPVAFTSTARATSTQPFQGLLSWDIVGTGLAADFAPGSPGGTSGATAQVVDAGALRVTGSVPITLQTGQYINPTITATTVTSVHYSFTRAAYSALNFA